jgi:hypothetical protein
MSLWGMLSAWKRSVFLFRVPGARVLPRAQGRSLPSDGAGLNRTYYFHWFLGNNDETCPYAPHAPQDQARPD